MNVSSIPPEVKFVPQRPKLVVEFLLLLAVGIVIFLATNEPVAGAVLPSIYAGWRSFRTGLWILRSDQSLSRARVCCAFCIATAFWQSAATAFVSVIVFAIAANLTGNAPDMQRFAATMITLTGGVGLTTVVGLGASTAAKMAGIRVWVHPRLREMVNDQLEKAVDLPPHRYFNHAVFVIATSFAFPILSLCCALLVDFRSGIFTAAVMIVGPLLAFVSYSWLASRIVATHPAECWK
jgi:hypothetical protein